MSKLSLFTRQEDTTVPRWNELLLEELMTDFATTVLLTNLETVDDLEVIRLESADLATQTRIQLLDFLVRSDFLLQTCLQFANMIFLSVLNKLSLDPVG